MKLRNTKKEVFCPLCKCHRTMKYSSNLSIFNYLQITLVSAAINATLYTIWPDLGAKLFVTLFVVWPLFEINYKVLYRKEIACTECGFDATWYKRDVKVARRLVQEFWDQRSDKPSEEVEQAISDPKPDNFQNEAYSNPDFDEPIVQI
jgi:hypothetical protein